MSSPWAPIAPIQPVDLNEIQSEQYARSLQDKEDAKFSQQMTKQLKEQSNLVTEQPEACTSFQALDNHDNELEPIHTDCPYNRDDFCESDRIIAEMMQAEFDREHDKEVQMIERQKNKNDKVTVSLKNYRTIPDELLYDSDDDNYDLPDPKNWDCFELNQKLLNNLPKKGFGKDDEGLMITKHDETLCGVRNAGRVMSFPPEFQTGDAAGIKLSNAVFNQLKIYSQKKKTNKAYDRRENIATAEMGVDERTRIILYKMVTNQILKEINGIISTGKEAVILHAESDPAHPGEYPLPKHCAIKIFKTTLNEFKQRDRYIKDDFRFKDRFCKQNSQVIINMWAEKEMYNLKRMRKYRINCPQVVILKKYVLVMSFIGNENVPALKLKDAILTDAERIMAYEEVVDMMHRLYTDAKLIHADLSEYNILWHDQKCWFIDVAQSVEPEHPSALEFLLRDCGNISSFFTRCGVSNVKTKEELFTSITGYDASNVPMLERLRGKGANVIEATAPNSDEIPESVKPISYPFEYAWEKSKDVSRTDGAADDIDAGTSTTNSIPIATVN